MSLVQASNVLQPPQLAAVLGFRWMQAKIQLRKEGIEALG